IAWVLLSVLSIYVSMCFAELTSMFPKAGGVYEFCKQAYGKTLSFIIGWTVIITGNITIAMLVVGAIQYLLPVGMPIMKILLSLVFIFLFNYIAFKGMKTSAVMLVTFAFITMGTILLLIVPGLFNIDASNLVPFIVTPIPMILVAVFMISETFFGWETATFLAAETKDGKRVMPKVLVTATIIIAAICILLVFVSLGVMHWQAYGKSATPLSDLAGMLYGTMGSPIFTILVYLAIIGSVAGWIVSSPRLLLAMAQDKLFLGQFAAIHPKNHTPYKAILFQTALTTILVVIGAGSYETLLQLLIPLVLVMYSFVLFSVVILRFKKPNHPRYYWAPWGKFGPILVILCFAVFIFMWVQETHGAVQLVLLGLSFLVVGLPIYFLVELYHDPKVIVKVNDFFAYVALLTEDLNLPKKVRRELMALMGNMKNKTVLEYGCSVGTMTLMLAEEVKPNGLVYATSISPHEIAIADRRMKKEGHNHVTVLLDKPSRIHPKVPQIDMAVSVGTIGNVEREEQLLYHLNKRLRRNARIVFLDYDKFYDVIPNIEWLGHDEKIKKVFAAGGFDVDVIRKQGLAWQYIYIFGRKVKDVSKVHMPKF
ncbi:amino acid permease, partial [Nanoarchaeota archaeon]